MRGGGKGGSEAGGPRSSNVCAVASPAGVQCSVGRGTTCLREVASYSWPPLLPPPPGQHLLAVWVALYEGCRVHEPVVPAGTADDLKDEEGWRQGGLGRGRGEGRTRGGECSGKVLRGPDDWDPPATKGGTTQGEMGLTCCSRWLRWLA